MSDTAIAREAQRIAVMVPDLEEKYRRVVHRRGRLERLVQMRAPGVIVRNEKRMLKAAMADLFGEADDEETMSFAGGGVFAKHFTYIAGADIESPAAAASGGVSRT